MSKKKTKKFRAGIKSPVKTTSSVGISDATDIQEGDVIDLANELIETKEEKEHNEMLSRYAYVRKDVRKLGLTFSILVLLFIGFYVLNSQTSILADLGNWLYKIGNFQI
ncbi:MAG: hypothetical protein WCI57_05135 [Candidatus Berkelbacteria bacterium]